MVDALKKKQPITSTALRLGTFRLLFAGVTADLDPPRIWTPRSKSASGYGPPLADLDPLKTSVLLSKIGKIVFWSC